MEINCDWMDERNGPGDINYATVYLQPEIVKNQPVKETISHPLLPLTPLVEPSQKE